MNTPRPSRPNRFQPYVLVPSRRQAALAEAQRALEASEAEATLDEAERALEEREAQLLEAARVAKLEQEARLQAQHELDEAQRALQGAEARRSELRFRSLVRRNPRLAPIAPGAAQATTPPDHINRIKVIVHGQCYIHKDVTLYFAPSCSIRDACIKIYAALAKSECWRKAAADRMQGHRLWNGSWNVNWLPNTMPFAEAMGATRHIWHVCTPLQTLPEWRSAEMRDPVFDL